MTAGVIGEALCMGFSELGGDAFVFDSPPSSNYAGIIVHRPCGPWSVIVSWDSGKERVALWPSGNGDCLLGPPLSDPQFFEKCLALMVSENVRCSDG